MNGAWLLVLLLGIACSLAGALTDMERTRIDESRLWQRSTHQMAAVEVNKAPLGGILAPLLSYKFLLPMPQLRAGFAYAGSRIRLRRFVRDLLQGRKPIKIGAIGGSITWGQGTSDRSQTSWFSVVAHWLAKGFPSVNITARNGAVPATPASYMVLCMDHYVDPDVDLVLVEYILNNGFEDNVFHNEVVQVMERLIRRLLDLPGKPAVVMMQVPTHGMASYDVGMRFYQTMEDLEGALAQYYDVQYLSLRTALYRLAAVQRQDGFRWDQIFVDHHPGDTGNRVMADLVAYMIQDTAMDLLMDPFSIEEQRAIEQPLPEPMYDGNSSPGSSLCLIGSTFQQAAVAAEGFSYVNEGDADKPKWGYVAEQAGARLVLRFDTRRRIPGSSPGEQVGVYLQYLRSYEHMGMANISCTSGCACEGVVADGHIPEKVSQTYQLRIMTSQSANCEVTFTVLERTSSGQHKFKVSGAVISETRSSANMLDGTSDLNGRLYWEGTAEKILRRQRRQLGSEVAGGRGSRERR